MQVGIIFPTNERNKLSQKLVTLLLRKLLIDTSAYVVVHVNFVKKMMPYHAGIVFINYSPDK